MATFPNVSETFPNEDSERLTFPNRPFRVLKESGNVETCPERRISLDGSTTFPNGRPVQTRLYGGAAPRLERIVQGAGIQK